MSNKALPSLAVMTSPKLWLFLLKSSPVNSLSNKFHLDRIIRSGEASSLVAFFAPSPVFLNCHHSISLWQNEDSLLKKYFKMHVS